VDCPDNLGGVLLRRLAVGLGVSALLLTTAACTDQGGGDPGKPPAKPAKVRQVIFGTFGTPDEIKAMRAVVDDFNAESITRKVKMVTWPDHETAAEEILNGKAPDVFMASRIDLGVMATAGELRPVDLLLDERGVDFGDRFSRSALNAFALDEHLQCMPYSVSPMVIYYNTRLVNFDKMAERGLNVPYRPDRWTLQEFGAAAQFAARRNKNRGVWIEPTLEALTPFIESGGGRLFDDGQEPTTLTLSDEDTSSALAETLAILRDPTLTPTADEMATTTPLEMFKAGKLGIMAGFRHVVPELRAVEDLDFDVAMMPNAGDYATVGDMNGMCISSETRVAGDAADFITFAVTDEAMTKVTETGYILPSNTEVAGSDAFLDTTQEPAHPGVFNTSIRFMVVPPFIAQSEELTAAVSPLLQQLLTEPGAIDLEARLAEIDEASRVALAPVDDQTESGDQTDSGD
jgi:multiple sugar transport system substrate-binding protein